MLRKLTVTSGIVQKRLYYSAIVLNIGLLFIYKLLQEVISDSGIRVIQGFDNDKWIILGLGFYTLQILSYYFEAFKAKISFKDRFSDFFISIAFFAKLPSGPILNYRQSIILPINKKLLLEEENIAYGIQRVLLGLFKKIALADRLLPYVSNVFDEHLYINGLLIYLSPFLFTMQLYFDFSGYIDIAIGSARLFGIKLPENFNLPLRAQSIAQFWRRWHITLVNWLTSYVFYPLSFRYRKLGKKGLAIAVIVTFLVSAAWHGLALTFFVWALCHFLYIILESLWLNKRHTVDQKGGLGKIVSIVLVWHLVALGNFFFRLHSLQDAKRIFWDFYHLPFLYNDGLSFKTWLINGGQDIENEFNFRLTLALCFGFLILEKKINQFAISEKYRVTYGAVMLVLLAVFGMFNTGQRFIYMQF